MRPRRRREPLIAYLYRTADAAPKRRVTKAMATAIAKAVAARKICHGCNTDVGYIPPAHTGRLCLDCHTP